MHPYFVTPGGEKVKCDVMDYVPYVRDRFNKMRAPKIECGLAAASRLQQRLKTVAQDVKRAFGGG